MAKKGQKFSKYTLEEKQKFINMVREEGYSTYDITREFGIPNGSIKNWLYSPEKSMPISKRGRPRNDDEIDYKSRYEILKKFRAFLKEQQEKR